MYMRQLPAHTTLQQMQTLEKLGKMCHLIEHELHHFSLCMCCALTRRSDIMKALFRYDTIDRRLVCNECTACESVVHGNLLGRILYVRDKAIVLCNTCLQPKHWDAPCVCSDHERAQPDACCVCNGQSIVSHKEIVDIQRFRMQTVHFCYKHSLSCVTNEATVYDVKTLQDELHCKRPRQ